MALCAACGTEIGGSARFCPSCGSAVDHAGGPGRRPGSQPSPVDDAGSRRVVSVLFADVVGSTELGHELDPETLRRHVQAWFATARGVIGLHGGTVEKFVGDAVLAVFGVPRVHEDDALRAIRAAIELRDTGAGPLAIRIGIDTGEVVAGDLSSEQSFVTGTAVNMASRLQAAADPGEVLVGEATYRLARDAVEASPTEPLALKGISRPAVAYRIAAVRSHVPAIRRRMEGPMVGRGAELERLVCALARAESGSCPVVITVVGQPGIGKSRLVHEFLRTARDRAAVIRGRCLPYGDGITYWPIRELIRDASGIPDVDAPVGTRRRVDELVAGLADERLAAERLAALAGLGGDLGSPSEIAWAVFRLIEHLSSRKPLVIVIDDIQWAEPVLLDLVDHAVSRVRSSPVLLVCMARPELIEVHRGWMVDNEMAETVRLAPLPPDDGARLVGELLGDLPLALEARERIAAAADGNPLFIEQLLLMLVDDGAIAREDGRWVAREPLDEIPIPPSIAALLAARLDRLPPGPRTTLEHAAVIGKVFQWGAVADLLPEADRLDVGGHLGTLVRRELVIPDPTSPAGDEAFRFRHLLVRDAAYAGIPKRTRADIHERVAAWLDGRSSADLGDTDLVIGHHLEQASELLASLGDGVRAARLAEQALDRIAPAARAALDRGDPRVAVPLLRRAVDLSPPGPGRAAGLFDLGVALALAGDVDASDAADAGAVALLAQYPDEGLDQRRRLLAAWAVVDRGEASLEMLDTIATDALEVYERLGDPAGMMRALSSAGMSRAMRGQFGAEVRLLDRAMGLAIEAGRPARAAEFAATIANRLPIGPVPVADALERCRHYALAVGDNREALATIMLSIGLLEAMSGVAPGWRRRFDEARAIIDDLGIVQPVGVADHPMLLAMAELVNGDPGRTDALLRWSCAELTRLGDRGHLATVAPLLAETLLRCDRLDEVEHWVMVGRDAAAVDDIDAQVRWRFLLALLRSAQGRHDEARPLAHAAVDLVATTEFVVLQADAQLALARVLRRAGQEAGARAAADEARRLAVAKGNVAGRQRIDAFLAT